jgi:hypothetical protein
MAMIAVIALIAASRGRVRALFRTRGAWVTLGVLAVGAGVGLWWTLMTNTLSNMGQFQGQGISPFQAFVAMVLDKSPDPGMIALFGWLDTTAPTIVYALWSFLVLAVLLTAVIVARGRMLAAVLISVASFFGVPALVQAASIRSTGYIWQGRYSLIAYACVLIVSAVAIATSGVRPSMAMRSLTTRAVLTLGGLVALGQAWASAAALRRYAVGASGSWTALVLHPRWQPPGSSYLWILVSLVGAALIVVAWLARSQEQGSSRTADRSESTDSPEYPAEEHSAASGSPA